MPLPDGVHVGQEELAVSGAIIAAADPAAAAKSLLSVLIGQAAPR